MDIHRKCYFTRMNRCVVLGRACTSVYSMEGKATEMADTITETRKSNGDDVHICVQSILNMAEQLIRCTCYESSHTILLQILFKLQALSIQF